MRHRTKAETGRGKIGHGGLHQLLEKNAQEVTFLTPLLWLDLCSTLWIISNITQHTSGAKGQIQTCDSEENRGDRLRRLSSERPEFQHLHKSNEFLTAREWIRRMRARSTAAQRSFSLAPFSMIYCYQSQRDLWDNFALIQQQISLVSGMFLISHSNSSLAKVAGGIYRGVDMSKVRFI